MISRFGGIQLIFSSNEIIKFLLTFFLMLLLNNFHCGYAVGQQEQQQKRDFELDKRDMRILALQNIHRLLETYGTLNDKRLLNSENYRPEKMVQQKTGKTKKISNIKRSLINKGLEKSAEIQILNQNLNAEQQNFTSNGIMKIRADLRTVESTEENDALNPASTSTETNSLSTNPEPSLKHHSNRRHLRSTAGYYEAGQQRDSSAPYWTNDQGGRRHTETGHNLPSHHRRRRKGCPPLHGKDQLLCPSRNLHRYDVCITREQLCNHVHDCPDGEDENPKHCFFYKPLDDQLKTLSHAVLLLVESVMSEQKRQNIEL